MTWHTCLLALVCLCSVEPLGSCQRQNLESYFNSLIGCSKSLHKKKWPSNRHFKPQRDRVAPLLFPFRGALRWRTRIRTFVLRPQIVADLRVFSSRLVLGNSFGDFRRRNNPNPPTEPPHPKKKTPLEQQKLASFDSLCDRLRVNNQTLQKGLDLTKSNQLWSTKQQIEYQYTPIQAKFNLIQSTKNKQNMASLTPQSRRDEVTGQSLSVSLYYHGFSCSPSLF